MYSFLKVVYKVYDDLKVYSLIWLVAFLLVYHFGMYKQTPNEHNVVQWDAGWFEKIKNHGYYYSETEQSSVPFFPAFAYTWRYLEKWFSISKLEICVVNFMFFLIGFGILVHTYQISNNMESLLILSAPCLFFTYVPYSEGLFYLFCSLIIYGLKKEVIWITALGLFLASMTRSIFIFVVPCILVTEILYIQPIRKKVQNILVFSASSFLGLFTVVWFQWQKTGVWFAFYKAHIHWGHKSEIGLPKVPLATWDIIEMLFIDLYAFWIGLICTIIVIVVAYYYFFSPKKQASKLFSNTDKPTLFSLSYLAFSFGFIAFLQREYLTSVNRYVFAAIFYSVFVLYLYRNYQFSYVSVLVSLITYLILFYLALPIQVGENQTMQFRMASILIMILVWFLYFYLKNWEYRNYLMYSIIFINVLIQVYLYQRFISGMWAG